MKQVLILPRFFELGTMHRAYTTSSIGSFLLEQRARPVMTFYDTTISSMQEGEYCAKALWEDYADHVQGVLFQGGNDLSPSLYGEENTFSTGLQPYRDYVEYAFMKLCIDHKMPVFGICRGMQLLNVVQGGTLYQDLEASSLNKHMDTANGAFTEKDMNDVAHLSHGIIPMSGGILHDLYGAEALDVNSYHHQGIRLLGKDLRVEALSDEGLVEAISGEGGKYFGVQWHPEFDFVRKEYHEPLLWWLGRL